MKILFLALFFISTTTLANQTIKVGSKTFTESYILAEIISQIAEKNGLEVERRLGLGGTGIVYTALKEGEIDVYAEYTGTISRAILKDPSIDSLDEIRTKLDSQGLLVLEPLGFNNTYAFAVSKSYSQTHNIKRISDLKKYPLTEAGFSYEFMKRKDGLPAVLNHYKMTLPNAKGIEHSLAYEAIKNHEIQLMEVYSTDSKISKFNLVSLEDDLNFFPKYHAVILVRKELLEKNPNFLKALSNYSGKISEAQMIALNSMVDLEKKSFSEAASSFLKTSPKHKNNHENSLWKLTKEHLRLVFISLLASTLFGVPLGVLASRSRSLGGIVLASTGILQTIPSLALLCFMIPVFGIGTLPAIIALFLYGLLPIVRSTHSGIVSIDSKLRETAVILGLTAKQRLFKVELPLAAAAIFSGIKTSGVINTGTATIAAFIGAGGYGSLIVTGLALNDVSIILMGAAPAAVMALILHFGFEWIMPSKG